MHLESRDVRGDGRHDHVDTALPQLVYKLVVLALEEGDRDVRVRPLVHGNGARHDDVTARGSDPNADPASVVVRNVAELLTHGALLGLEATCIGEKLLPRVGKRERDRSLDKLHPKLALCGGNASRERLLAHMHETGRAREAALLGNGDEVVHGLEVHAAPSP